MTERKLGRGLDFLIKRTTPVEVEAPTPVAGEIPVDAIRPNVHQPRRVFDIEPLNDLIESIRLHGIIQPIAVRKVKDGYELISGERRWRAVSELGLESIPATVHDANDQQMLELALIENIQREDLDPIEKGKAYRKLIDTFELTQGEAAKRLGQKRSTVANFIRLLDLPSVIQDMASSKLISMGQARALLAFADPKQQLAAAEEATRGNLTVRDLERLAKVSQAPAADPKAKADDIGKDPHLTAVATRLREALGTKVALTGKGKRGRIVIDYYDTSSLNRILRCIEDGAELIGDQATQENSIST
ncbi:MAG: ParB family chromosome partitioning protein [Planctomycetota bacterium]|jgi:ParB family chromosome partitioning protein